MKPDPKLVGGTTAFVRLKIPIKEVDLWRLRPFRPRSVRGRRILEKRLLRDLLSRCLRCPSKQIRFRKEKGGKPALAGPLERNGFRFNLSHSGDLLVVAIARGKEVGVDVEIIRKNVAARKIARRFFAPSERGGGLKRFFRTWTRREALLKGTGAGLAAPWRRELDTAGWKIKSFCPAPGYVGAVAVSDLEKRDRLE